MLPTHEGSPVLPCFFSCTFKNHDRECGDAVMANERPCVQAIKDATGAEKLTREFTKKVILEKLGQKIGTIRAGYVRLNGENNFQLPPKP